MESINKRSRKIGPLDDKVIISSEYYENDRPSYICSICNMTLSRLSDAGGNNSTYWCRHCSVEFDPAEMLEENPSYQYLTET
jgi:DNA-directed RNA polymerase subunit RPC12/RpoP